MKMKDLVFLAPIVMILLAANANAQIIKTPVERAKELKEKLNLTDKQTETVEKIYKNADNEIKTRIQGSGNRNQMRAGMKIIMNNVDAKILKILNDEQKRIYKSIIEARKELMERYQSNINH